MHTDGDCCPAWPWSLSVNHFFVFLSFALGQSGVPEEYHNVIIPNQGKRTVVGGGGSHLALWSQVYFQRGCIVTAETERSQGHSAKHKKTGCVVLKRCTCSLSEVTSYSHCWHWSLAEQAFKGYLGYQGWAHGEGPYSSRTWLEGVVHSVRKLGIECWCLACSCT